MSKKLYALLLPVLAIAAMAMTAGSAQAAFHWYKCEKKAGGAFVNNACTAAGTTNEFAKTRLPFTSAKLQVISFGKLKLTSGTISIECKVLNAGNIWNVTEATVGKDEIEVFINYECKSVGETVCSPVAITAKGLVWPTELAAGPVDIIGTVAKPVEVTANCSGTELTFKGTLSPKVVNPTTNEPLHFEFTAATGELEGPAGAKGKVEGNVRVVGFEHGENIFVENP
jgi:hypothetical protein